MPLDPRIPLGVQPLQLQNPLEALSTIAQLQGQRELTEARRLAAEEAREKRNRQARDEAAMQRAVSIGPDGQPTIDYAKLLPDVDAGTLFEVKKTVDENAKRMADLRTANLTAEEKTAEYLAGLARPVVAAKYHPDAYGIALTAARQAGVVSQAQVDQLLDEAKADPTAIQRRTDAAIARIAAPKAPELQKITTVDAQGREVTQFVEPTAGASYPTAPQASDVITVQTTDAQGRPVTKIVPKVAGAEYPNQPPAPSAPDLITVQTVDAQGKPVTMVVPKVAGATYPNQPTAGEAGGVKLSAAQQEDMATMLTVQDLGASALALGDQIKWRGTGPVAGRAGAVGARWFGAGGEDAERLRNLLGNIQGTIAKLRGGASFTPSEQVMLDRYTPTATDSVLQIKAKLKSLGEFITAKRENTLRVAGGQFTPRERPAPATPADTANKKKIGRFEIVVE